MLRRSVLRKSTFNPSYSTPEVRKTFKYEPDPLFRTTTKQAPRLEGVIKSWHFVERCGEIEVPVGASSISSAIASSSIPQIYKIRNAQSFETIMPTTHRSLIGTKVTFTPVIEEAEQHQDAAEVETSKNSAAPGANEAASPSSVTSGGGLRRCAINITMDLASTPAARRYEGIGGTDGGDAVKLAMRAQQAQNPPTWGIKDIRAETLFAPGGFLSSGSGPAYTGPKVGGALSRVERRSLGDGMSLEGSLVRVEPPRGMFLQGEVVAWSALHRSGLIRMPDQKEDDGTDVHYAISNVEAFASAMPTSIVLRGAKVQFKPVHMHEVANAEEVVRSGGACGIKLGKVVLSLAESIDIVELPSKPKPKILSQDDEDMEEIEKLKSATRTSNSSSSAKNRRFKEWIEEDEATQVAPQGRQYGVITRWSGGQGVIESATGRTFMIESAKEFSTYFDVSTVSVRGAVVEFTVPNDKPRFAASIGILSDMSSASEHGAVVQTHIPLANVPFDLTVAMMMTPAEAPAQQHQHQHQHQHQLGQKQQNELNADQEGEQQQHQDTSSEPKSSAKKTTKKKKSSVGSDVDVGALPVRSGVLVSYSPAEFQGVVKDTETGERFLLRDTRHDVQDFDNIKSKLARGCIMEFRAVGSSGRLATYASISLLPSGEPPTVADQDALAESENPKSNKPMEEAVAGPMSMSYWVTRFEKVGANMKEYKTFQQQALVPGQMPKDDEGKPMEEDPRKNDPWFNDSEKNRKIPGTNAKFSDLMGMNQMGMMELSHTARDPAKLQKKMKDLEDQVPAEMREQGMIKAREWGPKYLKRIQEGKKSGDYNFSFTG